MSGVDIDALKKAGKILESALKAAFKQIDGGERSGVSVADLVEEHILSESKTAFPCNIGVDSVAAHFSPTDDMPADFSNARLLKVDAGANVDGWLSDAAFTYVLDSESESIARAAYDALYEAVHAIRPGREVREIGRVISDVARQYGVKPISNLGGHQIGRYDLHAGLFIPNVPEGGARIEEGMQIAIEPFMTNGRGTVVNGPTVTIFSLERVRVRSPQARMVARFIQENYGQLPFAQKWIERRFGKSARLALYELARSGSVHQYPVLLERKDATVAQFETSIYVDKDGPIILTDVFDLITW